jgi:predicted  nucleic acid-binding Zn-ribbon protein
MKTRDVEKKIDFLKSAVVSLKLATQKNNKEEIKQKKIIKKEQELEEIRKEIEKTYAEADELSAQYEKNMPNTKPLVQIPNMPYNVFTEIDPITYYELLLNRLERKEKRIIKELKKLRNETN